MKFLIMDIYYKVNKSCFLFQIIMHTNSYSCKLYGPQNYGFVNRFPRPNSWKQNHLNKSLVLCDGWEDVQDGRERGGRAQGISDS